MKYKLEELIKNLNQTHDSYVELSKKMNHPQNIAECLGKAYGFERAAQRLTDILNSEKGKV